jgi:hypothetical protein
MSLWRWGGRHGDSAEAEAFAVPLKNLDANSPGGINSQGEVEKSEKQRATENAAKCVSTPSQSSLTLGGMYRACAAPQLFKSGLIREQVCRPSMLKLLTGSNALANTNG